ncbi:MAG: DUF2236 domain-containing protein [Chthoniobacterales bacterium]|nr:DUF2236 domain-containing protein [Chthoniobacterales bacterium]
MDKLFLQISGERILLLGGPGALVLQVLHPVVAKAVSEHSNFRENAWGRLIRTLDGMYGILFGSDDERERIQEIVRRKHEAVRGAGYSAMDPEAQCWVLATLGYTGLKLYERWVRNLDIREKDVYLKSLGEFGRFFGEGGKHLPMDWGSFVFYWEEKVARGSLGSERICGRVAREVLQPQKPIFLRILSPIFVGLAKGVVPVNLWERLELPSSWMEGVLWSFLDSVFVPLILRMPKRIRFDARYLRHVRLDD